MTTNNRTTSRQTEQQAESAISCELCAIEAAQRNAHLTRARYLLAEEWLQQEVANGYVYQYPATDYVTVMDFIANERLCCPFWHFTVEIMPNQGPIQLTITGPMEAKALLKAVVATAIQPE